jgi:hypothetical protein
LTFSFRIDVVSLGVDPAGAAGDLKAADVVRVADQFFERHAGGSKAAAGLHAHHDATVVLGVRLDGCDLELLGPCADREQRTNE